MNWSKKGESGTGRGGWVHSGSGGGDEGEGEGRDILLVVIVVVMEDREAETNHVCVTMSFLLLQRLLWL